MAITYSRPRKVREYKRSFYTDRKTGLTYSYALFDSELNRGADVKIITDNPNWRQNLALGNDASAPYTRREFKKIVVPLTRGRGGLKAGTVDRTSECTVRHIGNGYSLIYTADDVALRELALARFKRRLQSHYGNKNLMTPVAELQDLHLTFRGVTGLTTNFVKNLLLIRKTKGKNAYRYASDAWLTYGFGIAPLVSDVAEAATAVQDFLERRNHTFRISGTASKDWFSSLKETGETALYGASLTTRTQCKHNLSYKYTGGFSTHVESSMDYSIFNHFGFTAKNLIPTAWELVPYSWVFDYFTTIGSALSDTFTIPSGDLKYLVLNRRYTCEADIRGELAKFPSTGYYLSSDSEKPGSFSYFSFDRTLLSTLPRQSLRFKTLDEVGLHAVNKLLNLAALLNPFRIRRR